MRIAYGDAGINGGDTGSDDDDGDGSVLGGEENREEEEEADIRLRPSLGHFRSRSDGRLPSTALAQRFVSNIDSLHYSHAEGRGRILHASTCRYVVSPLL